MGQSSIHIQKASAGSVHHNSRENYSKSVVFNDEKNELWNNSKTAFTIYRDELKIRSEAYSNSTGQKLQSRAVTHLSAVINLEQHHTLKDLEKIKEHLEKEFDTKVFQMAIHRDEGKIRSKTTGEYLVSGTDFFYNPDDNKHYFNKRTENKKHIFENELNINDYVIEKNYHAHIEMLGLKSDGKAIRQDMNRFKLSKLQDFVAESLQMQRGKNYLIDKSSKRLDTHEFKASKKLENEIEKETSKRLKNQKDKIQLQVNEYVKKTNTTQKELKEEIAKLRAELKENGATRADYAQLEELNKNLKEEVKNKTLTIEQLQQQTNSLRTQLLNSEKEIKTLKTQINSLEAQKESNPSIDTNLTLKSDSNQTMAYLLAHKTIEKDFERSFEKKEVINANTFHTESVQVLTPVPVEESLYSKVKNNFKGMFEYMQKQYFELMQKFQELEKKNKELRKENAELKEKVKTLESEAPKQIKKETQDNPNVLDLLKEKESKSISLEDTERFVKEIREQIKNTGQELDR